MSSNGTPPTGPDDGHADVPADRSDDTAGNGGPVGDDTPTAEDTPAGNDFAAPDDRDISDEVDVDEQSGAGQEQADTDAGDESARRSSTGRLRRVARVVGLVAVVLVTAVLGGALGWNIAPPTTAQVGPLEVDISIRPSLQASTTIDLPPFGEIAFDTHDAPIAVTATLENVDIDGAEQLISSPAALSALEEEAPSAVIGAVVRELAWCVGLALAFAAAGALLVFRWRWRPVVATTVTAALVIGGLGGAVGATVRPESLSEPQFEGLLSKAPYVAQAGQMTLDRLESYRSGLADIVKSVSTLYTISDSLPSLPGGEDTITVLHISDLHLNPLGFDLTKQLVTQFNVDFVIDTGDVTSWGTPLESATLSQIGQLPVPYVFIAGNHDSPTTAQAVAEQPNAIVLNNSVTTVDGLTIAGIADPRFLPDDASGSGAGFAVGKAAVKQATETLSTTIETYDDEHPDEPVDIALVHDGSRSESLNGVVPLVLSGHMHSRKVTIDEETGTRSMVEGSTGGAVITSDGLQKVADGEPTPLEATLLYFSADEEDHGELLAYDEVTMGGLGLASVNMRRVVVGSSSDGNSEDLPEPSPTPTGTETGNETGEPTGDPADPVDPANDPDGGDAPPDSSAPDPALPAHSSARTSTRTLIRRPAE